MEFIKNNLFYIVLVAVVLVVSVPSWILGSQRRESIRRGQQQADQRVSVYEREVRDIEKIAPEAMEAALRYQETVKQEQERILQDLEQSNRHLDHDFLAQPEGAESLPNPEAYQEAYYRAYDGLRRRLDQARLTAGGSSPLPERINWTRPPNGFEMRVTQKKYWILKALVDVLTDRECGVKRMQDIMVDYVPNAEGAQNGPEPGRQRFWIYPVRITFQIDVRRFPVLLEKLYSNEEVFFHPGRPGGYKFIRSFDETTPVYVPVVAVTLYCEVWDYISTDWEQNMLQRWKRDRGGGGNQGGRR